MMSEVKLTVNGETIPAEEGETVLSACERNGIEIPTLCEHDALENAMACRVCVVEVNDEQIEPACGLRVGEDMEIKTDTEKLEKYRKMNLELIYLNENHFCMFCESDGDCELQDLMWEHEIDSFDFPRAFPDQPVEASHDFLVIDNNRCIKCGRCVRACEEVVGNQTLNFGGRGLDNEIVADTDIPLAESSCIECGMCQQICPTGAIFNKQSMFKGTTRECDSTATTCMKCSIGCGTEVYKRSGDIVEIMGTDLEDEKGGQLCKMGRFDPVIDERERIDKVIVQDEVDEERVDLEEGMEKVKKELEKADKINALASGETTSEALDAFEDTMREKDALFDVIGAERQRIENEVMRRVNMIEGHLIDDITDIMEADHLLVYDTSIVETHPVLASFIRRASINGTKLITVDTDEDRFWRHSDISITIESPNTQLTRLVNEVIKEGATSIQDLSRASSILGGVKVHPEDIMTIVRNLEEDTYDIIILGSQMPDRWSIRNIFELAKLEGSYLISLNKAANQHFKELETEELYDEPDLTYIYASDEKDNDKMLEEAEKAGYLIVQAAKRSELTEMADLVIPSLMMFERDGTIEDINGEEKTLTRVFEPEVELESEKKFFEELSKKEV